MLQALTADSWCCISQVLQYARDFWFVFFFFSLYLSGRFFRSSCVVGITSYTRLLVE